MSAEGKDEREEGLIGGRSAYGGVSLGAWMHWALGDGGG